MLRKPRPDALVTVMKLSKLIGKVGVVSGVCYGFIGNRMLEGYRREANLMLLEGAFSRANRQGDVQLRNANGALCHGRPRRRGRGRQDQA